MCDEHIRYGKKEFKGRIHLRLNLKPNQFNMLKDCLDYCGQNLYLNNRLAQQQLQDIINQVMALTDMEFIKGIY
jgi:hypothetical protein